MWRWGRGGRMKRWVVIETESSGYTQKDSPNLTFFKGFGDADKYLRVKINKYIECVSSGYYYDSIEEFLVGNCITQFETNEGKFFLEEVVFE